MTRSVFGWLALLAVVMAASPVRSQPLTADFDDLRQVPAAKKLLDDAAEQLKKSVAQGNESGVSVKSAQGKNVTFDPATKKLVAGDITVEFDIHHRHRTTPDRDLIVDTPIGKIKQRIPGIVAYDRHDDVVVVYDIRQGKGKARLAKGPLDLPLLPKIDWELWVGVDPKK